MPRASILFPLVLASLLIAATSASGQEREIVFHPAGDPVTPKAVRAADGPPPTKTIQPGPVLILPFWEVDLADPNGVTTLFAVRNGTDLGLRVRVDLFAADSIVASSSEQLDLAARQTRTFNLRGRVETSSGWASVTVIDPQTGDPIFDVAGISGDFFRLDPSNNFASGDALLSRDPLSSKATGTAPLASLQTKIVNGVLTHEVSQVGAVLFDDVFGPTATCTATLIGCRTVLTAARCVEGILDPDLLSVFFQHAGIFQVDEIEIHPQADADARRHDLAVLRLSRAVNGLTPMTTNDVVRPANGMPGVLLGFGSSDGAIDDAGLKRGGDIRLGGCSGVAPTDVNLCWGFSIPIGDPGDEVNRCVGDAGAPLLIDFGGGAVVAGVVGGGVDANCRADDVAWASDVFVDRTWIEAALGLDALSSTCGFLPAVGGERSTTGGTLIELGSGDDAQAALMLDVPADTSHLRLTVNGAGTTNDIDLLGRPGEPPTFLDHACLSEASGSAFEICEISSPEPGEWNFLVDLFSGPGGSAQLTWTFFAQPEAALPGFCKAWDLRFFNGGAFDGGTDFTFFVPGNPTDGEPVLVGEVYNEAGAFLGTVSIRTPEVAFTVNSRDLDAEVGGLGANFGTIEWRFYNGLEGNISGVFRASGKFSVGVPAICVDNLGRPSVM